MALGSEVDEEQDDIDCIRRTVADRHAVKRLGLQIDRVECSSYWGIAATPVSYYGRVAGSVPIRFSE